VQQKIEKEEAEVQLQDRVKPVVEV